MIYLDHAATTMPDPKVIDAVSQCMRDCFANPSSPYHAAGAARRIMRKARLSVGNMIGAMPQEVFFTSGGTEANNWALHQATGQEVVLAATEHKSVLLAAQQQRCRVTLVQPNSQGVIEPQSVAKAIGPNTALVSVQLANNETGVLQPIAEIGKITRQHKVLLHCDAVQCAGHLPIDTARLGVDLLSMSAHKLYGPRGIGCLYIKQGNHTQPLIAGGGQEGERRAGTENVAAIHGFGVAAELAVADMELRAQSEQALRELLWNGIQAAVPTAISPGDGTARLPAILSVLLPGRGSEEMIARLDSMGVMVAGGAACGAGSHKASHVLTAMGLSPEDARCVIRISLGRHTTEQEIAATIDAISSIVS